MNNLKSFYEDVTYNEDKVRTQLLLETSFSKEIRILLKAGQTMKEHIAPFPIAVHLLEGKVNFGVEGTIHHLSKGAIITLEAKVPHDLLALENSMVRLTLSKQDHASRVAEVAKNS